MKSEIKVIELIAKFITYKGHLVPSKHWSVDFNLKL